MRLQICFWTKSLVKFELKPEIGILGRVSKQHLRHSTTNQGEEGKEQIVIYFYEEPRIPLVL
jgi:hypothetical protein